MLNIKKIDSINFFSMIVIFIVCFFLTDDKTCKLQSLKNIRTRIWGPSICWSECGIQSHRKIFQIIPLSLTETFIFVQL